MTQPQDLAREQSHVVRASRFARLCRTLSAWRARAWWPWAVGLSMLLTGALAGWLGMGLAVKAMVGERDLTPTPPVAAAVDRAEVSGPATASGAPGSQVRLRWLVTNAGQATWTPLTHRFAPRPGDSALPVIALPGRVWVADQAVSRVPPGSMVAVEALIDIPAGQAGSWEPEWRLTGPDGPVEGGRLTAIITVTGP